MTYLLQNLGFVMNLKKSVFHPTQRTEFLEMIKDSVEVTVPLPQEVPGYIVNAGGVNKGPSKVFENISTALAIIPAPLYMRYLQRQQIHNPCLRKEITTGK